MAEPIRPKDLPSGTPTAGADYIYDSGTQVLRAKAIDIINAGTPLASQAEAVAGVNNVNRMTPLRVSQAIAALADVSLRGDLAGSGASAGPGLLGFDQSSAYASATLGKHNQRAVYWDDKPFNILANGSDETAKLAAFINHAIDNPGIPHYLPVGVIGISAELPQIDTSNVILIGAGCTTHDVGAIISGTYLKWVGASNPTGRGIKIAPVEGAGNQHLSNVIWRGIGLDCDAGKLGYGIEWFSVRDGDLTTAVTNAAVFGVSLGCVSSLGEGKDTQRNIINVQSRQVEAPAGYGIGLDGVSDANTSLNRIFFEAVHANVPAAIVNNADNNTWELFRTFCVGTATNCIELRGAATESVSARGEKFNKFSANLPAHIYGTEDYTYPSTNHRFDLDTDNGTPFPTGGTGATFHVLNSTSGMPEDVGKAYTPSLAAGSGAFTSATAFGRYVRRGKVVDVTIEVSITTNGTAATSVIAGLPFTAASPRSYYASGVEAAVTGNAVQGRIEPGGSTIVLQTAGAYPGGNGRLIGVTFTYEVA